MPDITKLRDIENEQKYLKGECVVREGDLNPGDMYLVLSGSFLAVKNNNTPNQEILAVLKAGDFFGYINMFTGGNHQATLMAAEDGFAAKISAKDLRWFIEVNPGMVAEFIEELCDEIERLTSVVPAGAMPKKALPAVLPVEKIEPEKASSASSSSGLSSSGLFPEHHGKYSPEHPQMHDEFLINKKYTCPACRQEFDGVKTLVSKLKSKSEIKCDLKSEHHNFSTWWYDVITCPHCLFSVLDTYIDKRAQVKPDVKEKLETLKKTISIDTAAPMDVNTAFTMHYLALVCTPCFLKRDSMNSKIWRDLMWLYEEVGDKRMDKYATAQAYESTLNYYGNTDLPPEPNQALLMILASLARKQGLYDDAIKFLSKGRYIKNGKQAYLDMITDEWEALREQKGTN